MLCSCPRNTHTHTRIPTYTYTPTCTRTCISPPTHMHIHITHYTYSTHTHAHPQRLLFVFVLFFPNRVLIPRLQAGFVECISAVRSEFIKQRKLRPVRAPVPRAPKRCVYRILHIPRCTHMYTLAHSMRRDTRTNLLHVFADALFGQAAVFGAINWPEGLQARVHECIKSHSPRLPTKLFCRVVHALLSCPRVRNRGYALPSC